MRCHDSLLYLYVNEVSHPVSVGLSRRESVPWLGFRGFCFCGRRAGSPPLPSPPRTGPARFKRTLLSSLPFSSLFSSGANPTGRGGCATSLRQKHLLALVLPSGARHRVHRRGPHLGERIQAQAEPLRENTNLNPVAP